MSTEDSKDIVMHMMHDTMLAEDGALQQAREELAAANAKLAEQAREIGRMKGDREVMAKDIHNARREAVVLTTELAAEVRERTIESEAEQEFNRVMGLDDAAISSLKETTEGFKREAEQRLIARGEIAPAPAAQ